MNQSVDDTVVTVTSPIFVSTNRGKEAVAAVAGLQMKLDKFADIFINSTKYCPEGKQCNLTCERDVSKQQMQFFPKRISRVILSHDSIYHLEITLRPH